MCGRGRRRRRRRIAFARRLRTSTAKLIVGNPRTMTKAIDGDLIAERAIAMLATVFGGLAAVMAGIGLYGILAYSTAQRTREIGIRMALGAQRGTVVRLILREVMVLAGGAMAGDDSAGHAGDARGQEPVVRRVDCGPCRVWGGDRGDMPCRGAGWIYPGAKSGDGGSRTSAEDRLDAGTGLRVHA